MSPYSLCVTTSWLELEEDGMKLNILLADTEVKNYKRHSFVSIIFLLLSLFDGLYTDVGSIQNIGKGTHEFIDVTSQTNNAAQQDAMGHWQI